MQKSAYVEPMTTGKEENLELLALIVVLVLSLLSTVGIKFAVYNDLGMPY